MKGVFDSRDAEIGLLATILCSQKLIHSLDGKLSSGHFSDKVNGRVFDIFCELNDAGVRLHDPAAVAARLKGDRQLASVCPAFNAAGFLGQLAQHGHPQHLQLHLAGILEASQKRRIQSLLDDCQDRLQDPSVASGDLTDWLQLQASLIGDPLSEEKTVPLAVAAGEAIEQIKTVAATGEIAGIPTGLFSVDGIFGGWHYSELSFIAGPPGGGKTSFLMQAGRYAAQQGWKVLIASLEMDRVELAKRELCSDSQVSSQALRLGDITPQDLVKFEQSAAAMSGIPLHIYDPPSASMTAIRAEARRYQSIFGLDLLMVDYLSLIIPCRETRSLNGRELVGNSARRLKQLAKELQIAVVCLSQVNREGAKSERLSLHHLAESSEVERNADNVIFLNWNEQSKEVVVDIAKHRHGPKGYVRVRFDDTRTRFSELRP